MKAILQRVLSASVTVDSQLVSSIGKGVLVFAAVAPEDTQREVDAMAEKVLKYKMWPDDDGGNWKKSVTDIDGEVLCVSQFTLLAKTKKGTKPDFHGAAGGDRARELYARFVERVKQLHNNGSSSSNDRGDGTHVDRVKDGVFQAMMQVGLVNDGPVTLELEVNPPPPPTPKATGGVAGKIKADAEPKTQAADLSGRDAGTSVTAAGASRAGQ